MKSSVALLLLFVWCLFYSTFSTAGDKPQVLIVHSSYETYSWTDSIQRSIEHEFSTSTLEPEMWIEYIDT
ncbi:hypothetical protein L4C32_18095, partial [Aliivibrio kagoshimensis]